MGHHNLPSPSGQVLLHIARIQDRQLVAFKAIAQVITKNKQVTKQRNRITFHSSATI